MTRARPNAIRMTAFCRRACQRARGTAWAARAAEDDGNEAAGAGGVEQGLDGAQAGLVPEHGLAVGDGFKFALDGGEKVVNVTEVAEVIVRQAAWSAGHFSVSDTEVE